MSTPSQSSSGVGSAIPSPLSVVTLGNSVAFMQMGHDAGSNVGNYTDVVAAELVGAGIPCTVANQGRWFDFVHKGLAQYESRVRPHRPNVLILNYGLNESQPWLVPVWLIGHLIRRESATTRIGEFYREKIAERIWRYVRKLRRILATWVGMRTWQTTPYRFEKALRRLIFIARAERNCLILVVDINPPGALLAHFLPGQEARHQFYQDHLTRIIEDHKSPDIRIVRSSDVCNKLGMNQALPDGMHLSRLAHCELGRMLAAEIVDWHATTTLGKVLPMPSPTAD